MNKLYPTNYDVAIHWCNNHYIRCNDICTIDEEVLNYLNTDDDTEIFQLFISDCSESDVKYLTENFPGLIFSYSPLLSLYILCVQHWGTSWDYVYWETKNERAKRNLGEKK